MRNWCLLIFLLSIHCSSFAGIDSGEAVVIGGIRQWITFKSTNEKNPVILFLHGGPGSSAMKYADEFTTSLQKEFVVVQWDQRNAGKTRKLNPSPAKLSLALCESDVLEMINYLRTRFTKDKIYLMGHSWGGFLTLVTASKHADLLHACFAISPMVWQVESERQTLRMMMEKAKKEKNVMETRELSDISVPFANGQQLYFHRKWLAAMMGQRSYSQTFVEGWAKQWLPLFNEASQINLFTTAPEINCPVYFMIGDKDFQTWNKLTERYYEQLKAPEKDLYWFENSAHSFFSSGQKKLQDIIIHHLLP